MRIWRQAAAAFAVLAVLEIGGMAAAQSESLCGADGAAVLAGLEGEWRAEGATSVESETLSRTEAFSGDAVAIVGGVLSLAPWMPTALEPGMIFDVDGVDDMLDTVEAAWIADAVSDTACGPEGLPQLSGRFVWPDDLAQGQITLLPYFSDRVVMIVEAEIRFDWGLAFVTQAALLTR